MIDHVPDGAPAGMRILSILFNRSSVPPEVLNPEAKLFPRYTVPVGDITFKSRSLTSLGALWFATAEPSGSFHAMVASRP